MYNYLTRCANCNPPISFLDIKRRMINWINASVHITKRRIARNTAAELYLSAIKDYSTVWAGSNTNHGLKSYENRIHTARYRYIDSAREYNDCIPRAVKFSRRAERRARRDGDEIQTDEIAPRAPGPPMSERAQTHSECGEISTWMLGVWRPRTRMGTNESRTNMFLYARFTSLKELYCFSPCIFG